MFKKTALVMLGVGLLPAAAFGCGGDDDEGDATAAQGTATATSTDPSREAPTSITVNLKNWAVEPSATTVKAGTVRFTATHEDEDHGSEHGEAEAGATHQLVVAPLEDGAEIGEGNFGRPALNLADIGVGEEKSGEAELQPGRYELSCLVVEEVDGEDVNHYDEGMYALLVVE